MNQLRASVVGASGYAGGEVLRLLLAHPHVTVAHSHLTNQMAKAPGHPPRFVTSVSGLLRHPQDEGSLIREIAREQVRDAMGVAEGRMKMKVLGAAEAVAEGVGRVVLADARVAQPIQKALSGEGTVIH